MSLVALPSDTSALERLVVVEAGKNTENDGRARVELDAHKALRDGVADVLKVHRRALDQHADRDDGVKGLLVRRAGLVARRRRGASRSLALDEGEEVGRADQRVGTRGLRLAALDEPAVSLRPSTSSCEVCTPSTHEHL